MVRVLSTFAIVAALSIGCGSDSADPKIGECQDYCDLMLRHCKGAVSQYSDSGACLATCEAMPVGDPVTHAGNTIACRTFAAAAAELSPTTPPACTIAGPGGDGVCGNNCESFCALADQICTGSNQQFVSIADCMTVCNGFLPDPPFDSGQVSGNTFECRLYHLTAASLTPETHCPHIIAASPVCL
jgi:hypothetical protein